MPDGPAPGTDADLEVARLGTAAMWAGDAASRMLGMQVTAVGPGTASVTMTVRDDMVNGWGTCHGGLLATLADSAFAVACNSRGTVTVAAGFDVSFLEAAAWDVPFWLGDVVKTSLVAMIAAEVHRAFPQLLHRD